MEKPILTPTEYYFLKDCIRLLQQLFVSPSKDFMEMADFEFCSSFEDGNITSNSIFTMLCNLEYKLNYSVDINGSTEEQIKHLVDFSNLPYGWEKNIDSFQKMEGYVIEDIEGKNKISRIQEHFPYYNIDKNGMIELGNDVWLDGRNSDLF